MTVRPAKTQDQPGHPPSLIRVFAVCMKKAWVLTYLLRIQWRLIRLGGCPGWSESSLGTQSFCWFCHEVARMFVLRFHGPVNINKIMSSQSFIFSHCSWASLDLSTDSQELTIHDTFACNGQLPFLIIRGSGWMFVFVLLWGFAAQSTLLRSCRANQ